MQTFGQFSTNFDHEYLTKHYIYINEKDEDREDIKISQSDFEAMLKKSVKQLLGLYFYTTLL